MDWTECMQKRIVKEVRQDKNIIASTKEIAQIKIESANALPAHLYIGKISLLYDALREYLESIALEKGYKIYNHECYTAFLQEVLNMPTHARTFDALRRTRNAINYYGEKVDEEEARKVIAELHTLIKEFATTSL